MLEVGNSPPVVEAGILIAAVLLEAVILYVGYGIAEEVLGDRLIARIKSR